MANSKVPVATMIPLAPMNRAEFYAVITQEDKLNIIWLFRKGCKVAHFCMGTSSDTDNSTMTPDGIRALDAIGSFNENKEILLEEN